jgi:hypothetical protein
MAAKHEYEKENNGRAINISSRNVVCENSSRVATLDKIRDEYMTTELKN